MNAWLDENAATLSVVLALASGVLLALTVVFLIAWLRARAELKRKSGDRNQTELTQIDLEIALAEQSGRLRIIRELHETAIHQITAMIAKADGAKVASDASPELAARAASSIADSARDTLADMRRVMTLVSDGEASAAANPQLQSTAELLRVMREAGLVISFEEIGEAFDLKAGSELTIYRILQEALSNALQYGGAGTDVRVTFTWNADSLKLAVDDDGIRNAARSAGLSDDQVSQQTSYTIDDDLNALTQRISGVGITQMRERTEVFGGIFAAKETPGVGFEITAVFPQLRFHNGIHGVDLTRRESA